jgi:hypothetical protein
MTGGVGQRIRDVTITCANGSKGIVVANQALNFSTINVHINSTSGAGNNVIGIDLKKDDGTGMIGAKNVVHVTTGNSAANQLPETVVDLPTGWNPDTVKNTTNDVIINGRRYYPPSDEF